MKKWMSCLLLVILVCCLCCEALGASYIAPEKAKYYCTRCGHFGNKKTCAFCSASSSVQAASRYRLGKTTRVLAGRSGPATEYSSLGTYRMKGEYVRIVNKSYDANKLCWLQVEVRYGSKIRRIYTGLKRFDSKSFKLANVPTEKSRNKSVTVIADSAAYYGPGSRYGTYGKTVAAGENAVLVQNENGFAQVEIEVNGVTRRVWIDKKNIQ